MTERKPQLSLVKPGSTRLAPPRKLGKIGQSLWQTIQSEYCISDSGGIELLMQVCGASDRLDSIGSRIASDGEVIRTKTGLRAHPLLREEVALRAFIARTIERLGLNVEAVKSVGRPGIGGWSGDD